MLRITQMNAVALELRKKVRRLVAAKKARGSIALKKGLIVSVEERRDRQKRAENTPDLDKLLAKA